MAEIEVGERETAERQTYFYDTITGKTYQRVSATIAESDLATEATAIEIRDNLADIEVLIASTNSILNQIESNTDDLEGFVDGIETLLTQSNVYLGSIETLITATNALLTQIESNTDDLEGFVDGIETLISQSNVYLSNIETLITSTNSLLTQIENNTDGLEGFVDGIEALITQSNVYLSSIDTKTPTLGQKTMAGSSPVVIASDQSPIQVVGNVASDDIDSGNPIKVGGVFQNTLPNVASGDRVDAQFSQYGEALTSERNLYRRISGATTVTVKSGAGYLRRICINRPTNGTATVYDNTVGAGTIIALIAYTNGTAPTFLEYGIDFTTGLTIVTTGANTDLTVMYL